jgi:hypothetical protein
MIRPGVRAGRPSRSGRRLRTAAIAVALALATAGSSNAESTSMSASVAGSVQVLGLEIDLVLSTSTARVGDKVRALATVANVGPARISNITVELRVDAAGLRVKGATTTTIARLLAGRTLTSTWTLCPLEPGNYLVLARATVDGASVESAARLLTVSPGQRKGCA